MFSLPAADGRSGFLVDVLSGRSWGVLCLRRAVRERSTSVRLLLSLSKVKGAQVTAGSNSQVDAKSDAQIQAD